ncbi:MAG: T9SS type A sorting domain-containing protein, partial [Bacteroidota bacterium]
VNNCSNPTVHDTLPDIVSEGSYIATQRTTGCDDNVEVLHMKAVGAGHTWPGAIALPSLGVTNQDIFASVEIWNFFRKYTHPNPVLTHVDPGSQSFEVEVGPSPFRDLLRIKAADVAQGIEIVDMQGKKMGYWQMETGQDLEVQTSAWAAGIYFVRVQRDAAVEMLRLVHVN